MGQAIKQKAEKPELKIELEQLGSIDDVLHSDLSLEAKAACIELARKVRQINKDR